MNRNLLGGVAVVLLAVLAIVAYLSTFIVDPSHQALVLRFGAPIRVVQEPGLKFRTPLIDNVVYLERRILDLDSPPLEIIASDQKRLIVDAFARYRITDPLRFYQQVQTISAGEGLLSGFLTSAVRSVLGNVSFLQVVRDERGDLMAGIAEVVDQRARPLGIEIVDVKIRRADLPEANSQAVYARMETDRQREATEIRATGTQVATGITANADRQVTVLLALATRAAEQTRGAGDARATCIFAEAYGRDPEFYAFRRSMEAYIEGLGDSNTQLVISPDSDFFRYFGSPTGSLPGGAAVPLAAAPPIPVECLSTLPPLPEDPVSALGLTEGVEGAGIDVIAPDALLVPGLEVPIEPAPVPEAPAVVPEAAPAPAPAPVPVAPEAPVAPAPAP